MFLIDKTASPPRKLDAILEHICHYQSALPHKDKGGGAIDLASCLVNLDYHDFGLRSYAEMKFYLDTLIDREYIDVVGDDGFEIREFHKCIRFPQKVRIHQRGGILPLYRGVHHLEEL